ncbi:ROK-family transcriptional regulator [Alloactinosynnema sp. L-07]|uniref:ROK family protein n=1 Tax=Alloactinosynnema sp. L-07 TaxID=1653480 RepID=UPI00065EF8A9|nr:ROK family protein [Alloactinosynnema sp. L-07]CRK56052.1 ROK-family transcriptional regulator [Alloactinosynnema sp. L-07]
MPTGMAATGPHVLRKINAAAVLAALRDADDQTARVSDLVLATGLSRPAVTRALSTLGEARVIESLPTTTAQVGRPAVRVRFRAELGHVAGVDVGMHRVQVTVTDLAGTVRAVRRETPPSDATGPRLVEMVRATLAATAADAGIDPAELWSVGIGTPGIVNHESGEVVLAPSMPGWSGVPLVAELRDWLGCPVLVDNDVNLAVVAERWRGEASDNLLFVYWGERIGSGIVIDGKPYRGASSAAGELGFIDLVTPIDTEPPNVGDGLGAFERLVAAGAILREAMSRCEAPLRDRLAGGDLAPLFEAAAAGSATAMAVVDTIAARFARGLATQILILDPERVIIGGGVSRAGDTLFDAVRTHLGRLLLVPVDLRASTLRENGVVLGAIRMALDAAEDRMSALL